MKKRAFLIYAVLWLLVISVTFYQQKLEIKLTTQEIAAKHINVLFAQLLQLQEWLSQYNRVYVPISEIHQPNPLGYHPERDLETKHGLKLTQIAHFGLSSNFSPPNLDKPALQLRLISLNPLNGINKPDVWESQVLETLSEDPNELNTIETVDGVNYYRFIKPIRADTSCFSCHTQPSSQSNKPFAAFSARIPATNIEELLDKQLHKLEINYLIIAVFGLLVMLISYLIHQNLLRRLVKARRHLKLAYMDVLTQLPNRRYYDFFVNREWKRASRQAYPISMIMIDIDNFKKYNDYLGHIQGDECLRQVATTLRRYFRRPGDLIARYGGEEFCVVAACDNAQIRRLAEILRNSIESLKIPHPGSEVSTFVTVSLGTASMTPDETHKSYQDLLQKADKSLFKAKLNGKNRVENFAD
jgi:diguanylate cyclase (GGDEF)-like protein